MTASPPAPAQRLFVAVNLAPRLRDRVFASIEPLRAALGAGVSWTPAAKLHVTLRFLGDQAPGRAADLAAAVCRAALVAPRHPLVIGGLGAFPRLRDPRVLWLGIEPNPALSLLYNAVDDALASLGVPREERSFHPHVTLGRIRPAARAAASLLEPLVAALGERFRAEVRSVELMRSDRARDGSRYTVLASAPLAFG